MRQINRLALAALAAPLALGLAACASGEDGGSLNGEPIDPIAAPEGTSWTQTATMTEMGGILMGNPDAPLKLVEYASHTCPACANFANQAGSALDEYVASGVVSFELRNQVHDPLDLTFATLVRCGDPATGVPLAKQGWADLNAIRDRALGDQAAFQAASSQPPETRMQAIGEVTGLLDWFSSRGISRDQGLACLADSEAVDTIISNSQTQSDELGVTGTPTFFLNDRRLDGTSWSVVETALQGAGAR
ncbi:thioredoxin domain-containing protein [Alteraurantiacibacter aquimixticola]|uniref:Protein-disulfide isomerase n=1 Tax=Alteraurantiacibacter aquimixticola TaxID=2489173 RepID=A0A4T3F0R6_9SPHN|nr:thioredoxin domain-containing protein [Alteraurantiacibacter aquimixticola]TIX50534.1 protein-disulfide isomerase [Alteraurantiacibacter aquimixticola]